MSDALLGWMCLGKFQQSELLQLPLREAWPEFSAQPAARFELFPQTFVGIKLVHQPLCRSLFSGQVKVRIHGPQIVRRTKSEVQRSKTGKGRMIRGTQSRC